MVLTVVILLWHPREQRRNGGYHFTIETIRRDARIEKFALNDVNSIHIINVALKNQIDIEYTPGHINNMITMGKGKNSNVIASTLSQKCSAIGHHITNNKLTTLMLLKAAGFPVPPKTTTATTIDKALSKSKDIGYPICIKPDVRTVAS